MRTLLLPLLALVLTPAVSAAQTRDDVLAGRVADVVRTYAQFSIFDDVEITVENGAVTLEGRVTMPVKKEEIGERAKKVDGVRSVTNNIGVLPLSPADNDLRRRTAEAIYSHPAFWRYAQMPNPPIHIVVEAGRITLTGIVQSEMERTLAHSLAQGGPSFGVTNRLKLGRR
jgi:hyperosmotically inducible protein